MTTTFLYDEIDQLLNKAGSDMLPEEAQGMLVGWLCHHNTDDTAWKKIIFKTEKTSTLLDEFFTSLDENLQAEDFTFELLLPEEAPLNEEAQALVDWILSFLSEAGTKKMLKEASPELKEALTDLIEISKLDYSFLENTEENQRALIELIEFTKMTAIMAFIEGRQKLNKVIH